MSQNKVTIERPGLSLPRQNNYKVFIKNWLYCLSKMFFDIGSNSILGWTATLTSISSLLYNSQESNSIIDWTVTKRQKTHKEIRVCRRAIPVQVGLRLCGVRYTSSINEQESNSILGCTTTLCYSPLLVSHCSWRAMHFQFALRPNCSRNRLLCLEVEEQFHYRLDYDSFGPGVSCCATVGDQFHFRLDCDKQF